MKRLSVLLVLFLVSISCCVTAFCHPGKTDANGGHYDNSTGEYHYHHGYPAHQHDDVDGDGVPDCPYEFDDCTGWNSGTNSGSRSYSSSGKSNQHSVHGSSHSTFSPIILPIILSIVATSVIIHYIKKIVNRRKQRQLLKEGIPKLKQDYCDILLRYQHLKKEGIPKLRQDYNDILLKYQRLKDLYYSSDLLKPEEYAHVPFDSYLDENGLPRQIDAITPKQDRYNIFVNLNTGIFHKADCRHAPYRFVNICEFQKYLCKFPYPCRVCHPTLPDVSWVKEYKELLSGLELLSPGITERHQILRKTAFKIRQDYIASQSRMKEVTAVYTKTANGMTVRVPIDKLDSWKAEQAKLHHDNFLSEPPVPISFENRNIDLYHVKSTCISHAGYDTETGCLFLRMKDTGYLYMYKNAPQILFRRIRTVTSVGGFYNRYIKGRYNSQRLNDIDIPCFHEEE